MKIIRKTPNGKVFVCDKCDTIHIEYKNLNFNLSETQFIDYSRYLNQLNGLEWEERNKYATYSRKIIIPTKDQNINMLLNNAELSELKILFGCNHIRNPHKPQINNLLYFTNLN